MGLPLKVKKVLAIPALALLLLCASCGSVKVISSDPDVIPVDSLVPPDAAVADMIRPYKDSLDEEMNKVVGYAARDLTKGPVESRLGNFVADLIEEKAGEHVDYRVDMGAITTGGLRVPIPEGPIRLGELYELMPFENLVWIMELNGAETRKLFEYAARHKNIAISSSVLEVEDGWPASIKINGKSFDPSRTYTLAISDYLAQGGDNMSFLKEVKVRDKLGEKLRHMIIEKVLELQAAGQKADAAIEGRVKIIKEEENE